MVEKKLLFAFGALFIPVAFCPPAFAAQETQYAAVFVQGAKVGYSIHTRAVDGDEVTTSDQMNLTIDRLGTPVAVKLVEKCVETTAGKPLRFEASYELGATTEKAAGTIREDGTMVLTIHTMGKEEKRTIRWPAGALMAEGFRLLAHEKGLTPGTEYTARVFKPRFAQVANEKVSVGERKLVNLLSGVMGLMEVTTVTTLPDGKQLTSTSYLDTSLRVRKGDAPIGDIQVEIYACPREFALSGGAALDLLDRMFVPSPEPIRDIGLASVIIYTLTPTQDADIVIPSTDNQKATRLWDGKISLEVKPVAGPSWAAFPYKGRSAELLEATRPTRYLQSDRKEVIELARKAVGNARHAAEAVRRIESFVAQYIDKWSLSVGYASAAEIVQSRQGDCSEFAVLTAGLCRAVGIPAQVVVGMAYVDNVGGRSGFGGHAWTRAYIGTDAQGAWVGLDATFKRHGRGYDAGHIALAFGSEPGDFADMAALNQLTVDKIQVRRR